MAKKKDQKTFLDEEIDLKVQYNRAEDFVNNNKSIIVGLLGVLGVIILGVLYFQNIYMPGQEKEAQEQMFIAQKNFAAGNFQIALDGDGNYPGFLEIGDTYSSMTRAANLAHYYSGVSYLNLGQYENAIDYLSKFSSNDKVLSAMALGATGDAYAELGNMDNAISFYKKAANSNDNYYTSPLYLMKAAGALESEGNTGEAKKLYEQVQKNFPESQQARNIEKYIARVEAK